MTDQRFVIDLGEDQRGIVEADDGAWLREKLGKEPGPTRLQVRYDEDEAEGHGMGGGTLVRVIADDDDTEGHALSIHFPSREEADAFRKRLMITGVLAGTVALGAAGGVGLANLAGDDASGTGAAVSGGSAAGMDWTQAERPDVAITGAGTAAATEQSQADRVAITGAGTAAATEQSQADRVAITGAGTAAATEQSQADRVAITGAGTAAERSGAGMDWTQAERPGEEAAPATEADAAERPEVRGPTPR